MTPGQIAKLQELGKCYGLPYRARRWVWALLELSADPGISMTKWNKADLRRLWHQYRPQIVAMRKNRKAL